MGIVIAEGYRGMGVLAVFLADRFLLPAALIVALLGAALIGVQLIHIFGLEPGLVHQI